ncbi:MAG: polysaccharide deacetylase family protein [bacterium]
MIRRSRVAEVATSIAILLVTGTVIGLSATAHWNRASAVPVERGDLDVPPVFSAHERVILEGVTGGEGVPVLCYHYFRPGLTVRRLAQVLGAVFLNLPTIADKDYWTTTVPAFERQMAYLAERGFRTIGLDELVDWMDGRGDIPPRSVVITIDDGDRSFVDHAVPVLRRHGYTATVFLITGQAGDPQWNDLDLVDWHTLRELERDGVIRVESHTHQMHSKVRSRGRHVPRFLLEYRDAGGLVSLTSPLGLDLRDSRHSIRRELGHESRFLAWPFGAGSVEVDALARTLGFRRTATLWPYRNSRPEEGSASLRPLGRYAITARTSQRAFQTMMGED